MSSPRRGDRSSGVFPVNGPCAHPLRVALSLTRQPKRAARCRTSRPRDVVERPPRDLGSNPRHEGGRPSAPAELRPTRTARRAPDPLGRAAADARLRARRDGKTALLASWASGRSDVAWLTVDRDDNWSPHFWAGVEQALDRARASGPPTSDAADVRRSVDSSAASTAQCRPRPRRLPRDREPGRPVELGALISHAPQQLRLVVSTRADPPLRIQRQQRRGRLSEVRAATSRSRSPSAATCSGPCGAPGGRDVDALRAHRRLGRGNPAAAMSLEGEEDQRGFVQRFAGRRPCRLRLPAERDPRPSARSPTRFLLRTAVPKRSRRTWRSS